MKAINKTLIIFSLVLLAGTNIFSQDVQSFDVNGLKVIFKQNTANDILSVNMYFKGGVVNLNEDQAGLESLTLIVAQKATKNYPKDKLNATLERMNTQINSNASLDYSRLSMLCVKQNFDASWNIYVDMLLNPSFSEEDLNLERDKLISSIKQVNDNPDAYLRKVVTNEFYIDHPYSVPVNGTEETLSSFTTQDMKDFMSSRLQTSEILLVVVGNTTIADLQQKVKDAFGNLPVGSYTKIALQEVDHVEPSIKIIHRELPTNYIQGTYSAPQRGTADGYTMLIANSILRDRVWEEVRTKRSLSYAPSTRYVNNFSNYGAIYVTAIDPDTTIKVMINELERLKNEPISDKELTNKVRQFITFYYMGNETNQAQANALAWYELAGIGYNEVNEFLTNVNKVTSKDIQDVAQKYMKNLQFVLIGNPESLEIASFMY
ncbi:MAG: insulinase family protein [Ignavibacteria bacterium]|nr:MAG: insulinase family protein [Ignavibacteria bacterium]